METLLIVLILINFMIVSAASYLGREYNAGIKAISERDKDLKSKIEELSKLHNDSLAKYDSIEKRIIKLENNATMGVMNNVRKR